MKSSIHLGTRFLSGIFLIAAGSYFAFTLTAAEPLSHPVTHKRYFQELLLPVGDSIKATTEADALLPILELLIQGQKGTAVAELESFLQHHPDSAWAPSLHANLAHYFRDTGRYTSALAHWQTAWKAVTVKEDANAKTVGDYVLAHWLKLLASLGRQPELKEIIAEIGNRKPSRVDWQKSLSEIKHAAITMEQNPGAAFKCGSFALYHVGTVLQPTNTALSELLHIPSPASGFSLASLVEIARTNGIEMRALWRSAGKDLVVPSVVHWQQNHYAAIVGKQDNYYSVYDPTFGKSRWLAADVINEEASGYFLVDASRTPAHWSKVSDTDGSRVFGRGFPNEDFGPPPPPCETCPCPPGGSGGGGGGGGSCSICLPPNIFAASGMPSWDVTEPETSLALYDKPMFYQPALGEEFALTLSYRQRESRSTDNTFPNFGPFWSGGWVEFIEAEPHGGVTNYSAYDATRYVGSGGGGWKYSAASGSSGVARDPRNGTKLESLWNSTSNVLDGFKLTEPNGNERSYKFVSTINAGMGIVRAFLTEHLVLPGFTNRFVYTSTNSVVKLLAAVDADGQTNTLFYGNTNFPVQITGITNSYGQSVVLRYDGAGLLTNIVDTVGLSNSFAYDSSRVGVSELVRMVTPYGTNIFNFTGNPRGDLTGESGMNNVSRSVLVTQPNGGNHLFIYRDDSKNFTPFLPYSESGAPEEFTGTSNLLGNILMYWRNSFYWGPRQYGNLSTTNLANLTAGDYLSARRRNYLHLATIDAQTGAATTYFIVRGPTVIFSFAPTLNMEQEPSVDGTNAGQRTWFGYFGKPQGNVEGTNRLPAVIARILPNGTTNYRYLEYNASMKVTKEVTTASSGGVVYYRTNRFTYSSNGIDQLTVTNAEDKLEGAYAYNANHQVLFSTNGMGEVTAFTYDSILRLTSVKTPAGLTTTNIYDGNGRLGTTIDLEINRTNTFTYTNGLVHAHVNERGLTNVFTWDALQRLLRVDFLDGTFITNTYDRLDLAQTVDRMGFSRSFVYNSARQVTVEVDENNHTNRYDYCNCGSLNSSTDATGNETSFSYDFVGRLTRVAYPDNYAVTNTYNAIGQFVRVSDSSGTTTNWFNNQGLLTAVSNVVGRVQQIEYDSKDRAAFVTDANGVTTTNTYDALDRLLTRAYPDGGVEKFGYTANVAGPTTHTNQIGDVMLYGYDEAGRKTDEAHAGVTTNSFRYEPGGSLTNLTDGKGQVTSWKVDEFGRVTNKIDHLGATVFIYGYDANGRLIRRWTPAKEDTFYTNDAVGNLTFINYANSPDVTLQYDRLNRLTNMMDGVGTTKFGYTAAGQLLSEDGPWLNDTVSYGYTSNRLRNSLTLAQPNASDWTQSYLYDGARRLTNVTSQAGAFGYLYDLTRQMHPRKLSLPNGAYITNSFDPVARLFSTVLKNSGNTELDSYTYGYNTASERTNVVRTDGGFVNYTYDAMGQLKTAIGKESGGTTNRLHERFGYAYDAAGNLNYRTNNDLTQTFNVNSLNQLTNGTRNGTLTVAGTTMSAATSVTVNTSNAVRYADNTFASTNHNLVDGNNTFTAVATDSLGRADSNTVTVYLPGTVTFLYDANGDLRTNGNRIFEYDDENQLIATWVSGVSSNWFGYDGKMRRRIERNYQWAGSFWHQTSERRFVYDGNVILQERDQANTPQVTLTRGMDLSGTLQGAGGIGGLLALTEHSVLNSGIPQQAHSYYHADGNGNITALVDTNQNIGARYLYDPFGNTLAIAGPKALVNRYRFSSKPIHDSSGMYDYLYRWYVPELQRWMNGDPFEDYGFQETLLSNVTRPARAEGGNSYAFVENIPTKQVDPWGLHVFKGCKAREKREIEDTLKKNCDKAKRCAGGCEGRI